MDKQRELFEKWCESAGYTVRQIIKLPGDVYASRTVNSLWEAWKAAIAAQWQPIETLPVKQLLATKEMFIVRGFGVDGVSTMPYTTDAYAVWLESDCGCRYKFARWKHNFQPTHWMPLQPEPTK